MIARLVSEQDRDAVLDLAAMAAAERLPDLGWDRGTAQETLDLALAGKLTIHVLEDRGALIGIAVSEISGFLFASGIFVACRVLYVRPDRRGTRAAATLFAEVLRWSAALKARRIYIGTLGMDALDERAARFFARFGAVRVGHSLEIEP